MRMKLQLIQFQVFKLCFLWLHIDFMGKPIRISALIQNQYLHVDNGITGSDAGSWDVVRQCPEGQFVNGFQVMFQPSQGVGNEDTGVNRVKMNCVPLAGGAASTVITSAGTNTGSWQAFAYCPDDYYIVQFNQKVFDYAYDSYGVSNYKFSCRGPGLDGTQYQNIDTLVDPSLTMYGSFADSASALCEPGHAMCAGQVRWDDPGENTDGDLKGLTDSVWWCSDASQTVSPPICKVQAVTGEDCAHYGLKTIYVNSAFDMNWFLLYLIDNEVDSIDSRMMYEFNSQQWIWKDGKIRIDSNWVTPESNAFTDRCVYLYKSYHYEWQILDCVDDMPYLCYEESPEEKCLAKRLQIPNTDMEYRDNFVYYNCTSPSFRDGSQSRSQYCDCNSVFINMLTTINSWEEICPVDLDKYDRYEGKDCTDSNLNPAAVQIAANPRKCSKSCDADFTCMGFVFAYYQEGNCWLKHECDAQIATSASFKVHSFIKKEQSMDSYSVSLTDTWYGHVLVTYAREQGVVCDSLWSTDNCVCVCRELGFSGGEAHGGSYYTEGFSLSKRNTTGMRGWLNNVTCVGGESHLHQCDHAGWGGPTDCDTNQDLAGCQCHLPDYLTINCTHSQHFQCTHYLPEVINATQEMSGDVTTYSCNTTHYFADGNTTKYVNCRCGDVVKDIVQEVNTWGHCMLANGKDDGDSFTPDNNHDTSTSPSINDATLTTPNVNDATSTTPTVNDDTLTTQNINTSIMSDVNNDTIPSQGVNQAISTISDVNNETSTTPNLNANISTTESVNDNTSATPNINGDASATPDINGDTSATPDINGDTSATPDINGDTSATPDINGDPSATPDINGDPSATPDINGDPSATPDINGDTSATPDINDNPSATPDINGDTSATPDINGDPSATPDINGDPSATPDINDDASATPDINGDHSATPDINGVTLTTPNINVDTSTTQKVNDDTSITPDVNNDTSPDVNQAASTTPDLNRGTSVTPDVNADNSTTPDVHAYTSTTPDVSTDPSTSVNVTTYTSTTPNVTTYTSTSPDVSTDLSLIPDVNRMSLRCHVPVLRNAVIQELVPIVGGYVTYICKQGYEFRSGGIVRSAVCTSGPKWHTHIEDCEAKHCAKIVPTMQNAVCNSQLTTVGTTLSCQCEGDLKFSNGQSVIVSECVVDNGEARWTGHPGSCFARCGELPIVNNSQVIATADPLDHRPGSSATFRCHRGHRFYDGRSQKKMMCAEDRMWQGIGHCIVDVCPAIENTATRTVNTTWAVFDTHVRLECAPGYTFIPGVWIMWLLCLEYGSWNVSVIPECIDCDEQRCSTGGINCGTYRLLYEIECPRLPNIVNANRTDSGRDFSSNATFKCLNNDLSNPDHLLRFENGEVENSMICEQGSQWSMDSLSCEYNRCPPVPTVVHADADTSNATQGSRVTYSCIPGYMFSGSSHRSQVIQCDNKQWNITEDLQCIVLRCNTPPVPGNASINLTETQYSYKSVGEITCNKGYTLGNNNATNSSVTLECGGDQDWVITAPANISQLPDSCSLLQCDAIGQLAHAIHPVSYNHWYGSELTLSCFHGYWFRRDVFTIKTTCSAAATWTPTPSNCTEVFCLPLTTWTGVVRNTTGQSIGTTVNATCAAGTDGQELVFEDRTTYKVAYCSREGVWIPNIPNCIDRIPAPKFAPLATEAENAERLAMALALPLIVCTAVFIVALDAATFFRYIQ